MTWVMVGVGTASLAVSVFQAVDSNKKAKKADKKRKKEQKRMKEFEKSRQPVINQADKIRATSEMLSNPAANLGVATQAADIQMQETDKALANTLDTIKQSGMGAGGATALAQAAAQSKAKVAANLESQEATNNKLAAEGEAQLQKDKVNIENKALAEEISAYGRQEDRDIVQLNRMQSEIENRDAEARAYEQQSAEAIMAGVGGAGSALSGVSFN
jgi:hypothetical protein